MIEAAHNEELKEDLMNGGKAIAKFIGLPEQTTYRLIANGEIPVIRVGKKIFGRKSEISARFRSAA